MGVRTTNISRLDESLQGGLRHSTITLLWAHPGVESAPFAYHILKESLAEGDYCVYVTACKDPKTVEKEIRSCGWDVSAYRRAGRMIYIDAYSSLVDRITFERFHVDDPRNAKALTRTLIRALKTAPQDRHIVVIYDSLSALIDQCGMDAVDEMALLKRLFAKSNATGVFLFTEWPYDAYLLEKLEHLSDAVIKFSAVSDKNYFQDYYKVSKLGWARENESGPRIPYRIEPTGGISIMAPEGA
jgi:KaiC/GvpD/RAD55 family RecA-like ATPase